MRDFGQDEQPELTSDDVQSILAAAALEPELPMPQRWKVDRAAAETRLKFNAPTPVSCLEVTLSWDAPLDKVLTLHLLYWLVDAEWEVLTVEGVRV